MSALNNTAEGYTTSPTTVTPANSGGGSGDAFDVVACTVPANFTAVNTGALDGAWSYLVNETTAANTVVAVWNSQSAASVSGTIYFKLNALPSSGAARTRLFAVRNAAGNQLVVDLFTTNRVTFSTGAGATNRTPASWNTALVVGQWYRFEFDLTNGTGTTDGTLGCRFYLGHDTAGFFPDFFSTTEDVGTTPYNDVRFGKLDGNGYANYNIGGLSVAYNSSPTANAGTDQQSVEPFTTVTLDGSGSTAPAGQTVASYAWTKTAGPAVTLSSASAQKPTYTAPAVYGGTTLTFSLAVTASGGGASTGDTVNDTILPHTTWRLDAGGALHALRLYRI